MCRPILTVLVTSFWIALSGASLRAEAQPTSGDTRQKTREIDFDDLVRQAREKQLDALDRKALDQRFEALWRDDPPPRGVSLQLLAGQLTAINSKAALDTCFEFLEYTTAKRGQVSEDRLKAIVTCLELLGQRYVHANFDPEKQIVELLSDYANGRRGVKFTVPKLQEIDPRPTPEDRAVARGAIFGLANAGAVVELGQVTRYSDLVKTALPKATAVAKKLRSARRPPLGRDQFVRSLLDQVSEKQGTIKTPVPSKWSEWVRSGDGFESKLDVGDIEFKAVYSPEEGSVCILDPVYRTEHPIEINQGHRQFTNPDAYIAKYGDSPAKKQVLLEFPELPKTP